jgi:glycine/D-amino acid oxidase-like deaminating enzyme
MPAEANLYAETAPPPPPTEPLDGDRIADLAVVGAGYAGLSAALHAARKGLRVVVLEARTIGFGGSGRNHGHCVPVLRYLKPKRAVATLGRERGERYTRLLADSGRLVFDLVRDYAIDCEVAPTGTLHVAHHPDALHHIARQQAFYAQLGKATTLLDRAQVCALTGSECYFGDWIHPEGGHLNPLAFARGLARAAMIQGATIHTESAVTAIDRAGSAWRVTSPRGTVRAETIAITTNAYTEDLMPPLGRTFFRLPAYGIASELFDPVARETILPGNHNVGDTHRDIHFYRFGQSNRLIVGGLVEARRGRDFAYTAAHMTRRTQGIFPQIRTLRWRWHWTGYLAINLDLTPRLYRPAPRLYALLGFSGRGVPTATALGTVLAEAADGVPDDELAMPIAPVRPIPLPRILSALVPRIRGPINRALDAWTVLKNCDGLR